MHFQMNFAAGYGLAIVQWVQLYYVCDLGRNIQVQFFFSQNIDCNTHAF